LGPEVFRIFTSASFITQLRHYNASVFHYASAFLAEIAYSFLMQRDKHFFIGLRFGYVRRRDGFSQAALGKALNLSRDQITNIESGRVPLRFCDAWKFCRQMLIHPDWLCDGGNEFKYFLYTEDEFKRLDGLFLAIKDTPFVDAWPDCAPFLHEIENHREISLTKTSEKRKFEGVKTEMQKLLDRVRYMVSGKGEKAKLAAYLEVPQSRLSEWLGGKCEPSGETTLKLLNWVKHVEQK